MGMNFSLPQDQMEYLRSASKQLMARKGHIKGEAIQNNLEFVKRYAGQDGVDLLQYMIKQLGYPLRFDKLTSFEWVPERYHIVLLYLLRIVFEWHDEIMFEMGKSAADSSIIVKTSVSFSNFEKVLTEMPELWRKYFDFSELEVVSVSMESRRARVRIKNYGFDPNSVVYFRGFLTRLIELVIPSTGIDVGHIRGVDEEEKTYTDFIINWG